MYKEKLEAIMLATMSEEMKSSHNAPDEGIDQDIGTRHGMRIEYLIRPSRKESAADRRLKESESSPCLRRTKTKEMQNYTITLAKEEATMSHNNLPEDAQTPVEKTADFLSSANYLLGSSEAGIRKVYKASPANKEYVKALLAKVHRDEKKYDEPKQSVNVPTLRYK